MKMKNEKNILKIKKINNNDLLPNYSFAKRKADYANNLINMSANQPCGASEGAVGAAPFLSSILNPSKGEVSPRSRKADVREAVSLSKLSGGSYALPEHNSLMKVVGEMVKSIQDSNSLSSFAPQPTQASHRRESGGMVESNHDTISINKNILPFFSIPVILKKISDQKKNKNLNLLNPQKKLVYKIIKLNTKLVEFTTNIKKYNFNLNSFKGNNLDFILFIKNNLYYNLKYRLSNILYKIEKFVPVFKLYSLLNNINLFSPKRLLKPQPYIRFSYRMKYITKITKPLLSYDQSFALTKGLPPFEGMAAAAAAAASQQMQMQATHKIMEINGRAINYLLVKLNNLVNEIEYIINIKNKFIK